MKSFLFSYRELLVMSAVLFSNCGPSFNHEGIVIDPALAFDLIWNIPKLRVRQMIWCAEIEKPYFVRTRPDAPVHSKHQLVGRGINGGPAKSEARIPFVRKIHLILFGGEV